MLGALGREGADAFFRQHGVAVIATATMPLGGTVLLRDAPLLPPAYIGIAHGWSAVEARSILDEDEIVGSRGVAYAEPPQMAMRLTMSTLVGTVFPDSQEDSIRKMLVSSSGNARFFALLCLLEYAKVVSGSLVSGSPRQGIGCDPTRFRPAVEAMLGVTEGFRFQEFEAMERVWRQSCGALKDSLDATLAAKAEESESTAAIRKAISDYASCKSIDLAWANAWVGELPGTWLTLLQADSLRAVKDKLVAGQYMQRLKALRASISALRDVLLILILEDNVALESGSLLRRVKAAAAMFLVQTASIPEKVGRPGPWLLTGARRGD